jgi:hypothetical protein
MGSPNGLLKLKVGYKGIGKTSMLNKTSIKIISMSAGAIIALAMAAMFGVPGLMLGAILGIFGSISLHERLVKIQPENRRRMRRTLRNEGLG